MKQNRIINLLTHQATRRVYWVVFAILFYNSGQSFTIWLLEPGSFQGGTEWLWLALFPLLLPAFFMLNRHLGCAGKSCDRPHDNNLRMPG